MGALPQHRLLTLGLLTSLCRRQETKGGGAGLRKTECRVGLSSRPLYQMQQ